MWVFCLNRAAFSQLDSVVRFMDDNEGRKASIPRRVRNELRAIRETVGLIYADAGAPLKDVVWVGDAEGDTPEQCGGFGVLAKRMSSDQILQAARRAERDEEQEEAGRPGRTRGRKNKRWSDGE